MKKRNVLTAIIMTAACMMSVVPVSAAENVIQPEKEFSEVVLPDQNDEDNSWFIFQVDETDDIAELISADTFLENMRNEEGSPENAVEMEEPSCEDYGISLLWLENVGGTWIQETDGRWWYQHTDGTYTTNDWEMIEGLWYYFDSHGYMLTGWNKIDGNWYFLNNSGAMQTGWLLDGVTWYYLDSHGVMQIGWIKVDGKDYYCDASGAMQTGWVYTGEWYYLHESSGYWIDNVGTQMIQKAVKYVGNPYVYGGNSLTNGIDCSGYTQQIHAMFGISIPRTSASQYSSSTKIAPSSRVPGDLVFFSSSSGSKTVSHVAFYMGRCQGKDSYIVHAANSKEGIIMSSMRNNIVGYGTYWR